MCQLLPDIGCHFLSGRIFLKDKLQNGLQFSFVRISAERSAVHPANAFVAAIRNLTASNVCEGSCAILDEF